jgi:restriction system protein
MARSGSLSEFELRLAAQRREDDRLDREQRKQDGEQEKARQQAHLESRQAEADTMNAAVQEQVTILAEVLTSVLSRPALTFERLMAVPRVAPFDPGELGQVMAAPDWSEFAPVPPQGLNRFLRARYDRQLAQAHARVQAAEAEHQQRVSQRRRALAVAKAKYDRKVTQERARAAQRNAYVADRQSAFAAGDPGAVEWFAGCALKASRYPDGFPREHQVAYTPENRSLTVDAELPPVSVVPAVRAHRYVRARDVIEPVPRQENEIRQRYDRLVSCVALRTLHEIFTITPAEVLAAVTFRGRVTTTDLATGRPSRAHLVAVSAGRQVFDDLVLAAVDPVACLARLNALVAAG